MELYKIGDYFIDSNIEEDCPHKAEVLFNLGCLGVLLLSLIVIPTYMFAFKSYMWWILAIGIIIDISVIKIVLSHLAFPRKDGVNIRLNRHYKYDVHYDTIKSCVYRFTNNTERDKAEVDKIVSQFIKIATKLNDEKEVYLKVENEKLEKNSAQLRSIFQTRRNDKEKKW